MSTDKTRRLVLFGDGPFAQIAYEYFQEYSEYEVVAFTVEAAFLERTSFCDRPVVPFEQLDQVCPPKSHSFFAAVVYNQMNRLRTRILANARAMGFAIARFISPRAFVWPNVTIGEHCFIFEDNVLQPFVVLGDNVILWSGNHIGHHTVIRDNCFISSHVVLSGYVEVQDNSFLGVNSAVANNVTIGADNWIGPGLTIIKDTPPNALYRAVQPQASPVPARKFFKIGEPVSRGK